MGGFGFARHYAPLRDTLFILVLGMLMIPGVVTLIPTFVVFSRLHLTNTYWPWVLWGLSGNSFFIFLFRQFFMSIPRELEDAAEVDGCGRFRIFWQIFLPNSGPVIATAAIFNFQGVWSDWFIPKVFLSDSKTTLSVKLQTAYVNQKGWPAYNLTFAAIFVFILPMIIVFFLAQKYIIQGIVTTGIKG
jgi:ABC-type glycerol-3-phosphate transport system permease component